MARPHGSPEELERRRQRAIVLLNKGLAPVEVAKAVGVDRRSVRRWNAAYRQSGKEALKANPATGRPAKLNDRQKETLRKALLGGAKAAGFDTDLWTCLRVSELIRKRFSVQYHVDHVCRLLHALGFSPQKPQRYAAERDEAYIQQWVSDDWPRIKKKRRG